jgi:predicted dehydrogenase
VLRIAVVGAGHWGPNLIGNFHTNDRSHVEWVVDRDEARIDAVRQRFPDVRTSASLDEALGDPTVDAVVIATPTRTHYELTKQALEAGKHVLVEKPLADSVESSLALCELAEEKDRVLLVGHVFVYNGAARYVKERIDAGDLGRIYYISMMRTNLGPIRIDVDAAWDLAAHDVSLASFWLNAWPESVSAVGGSYINAGIADVVFSTLRYPEDVLVNLHASWLNPRKARDITVVGDKQMLTFDDVNAAEPIRIYDKQVADDLQNPGFVDSIESFRMSVHDGDISVPRVPSSEPLRNECEHFLDCVLDAASPLSGGREGLGVVRVLDAISRSLADGGRETAVESA